jgi:hypothetical protein
VWDGAKKELYGERVKDPKHQILTGWSTGTCHGILIFGFCRSTVCERAMTTITDCAGKEFESRRIPPANNHLTPIKLYTSPSTGESPLKGLIMETQLGYTSENSPRAAQLVEEHLNPSE